MRREWGKHRYADMLRSGIPLWVPELDVASYLLQSCQSSFLSKLWVKNVKSSSRQWLSSKTAAAAAVGGISIQLSILKSIKITGGLVDAGVASADAFAPLKPAGKHDLGVETWNQQPSSTVSL